MKTILSSRRHHYVPRVSIFLITVALIAGMVGCGGGGGDGGEYYALTVASTTGGSVTTPGEVTRTYEAGMVVDLVVEAEEGYWFVQWTGDVNSIADVNDATTTITMNGDYSIAANFEVSGVLFSDDFSDEGSGWVTYDEYDGQVAYLNGCLYVKDYTDPEWCIVSSPQSFQYFTDFILEVETWLVGGTDNNWHMVLCRMQDADNYYAFVISADGYYMMNKSVNGNIIILVSPTHSTYINQGVDGINLIHIECIGSSLSLSVNEHLLCEGTDATFSGGPFGLGAHAQAFTFTEVAFDNIVLSEPSVQFGLTIASTAGGSVTTPGEGTFAYDDGTVVNLVATPNACCHFVNWTGDVGTIADVDDATTTIIMNGDLDITANFEEEAVTFADPNLEAAVRGVIAIPEGSIYPSDLDRLYSLSASEKNIADLTGLECATSLMVLELESNQISDISPLANLTSLSGLSLEYNQIGDISPLANLTTLTVLDLGDNQISDISTLANLTSLIGLSLDYNQIGDISPLGNLTHLDNLHLYDNQISDISPLANLTNLEYLYLWNNQISDISPLVDNEGLSEGDQVDLTLNPLSSDSINIYIPQLEARGVIVIY